MASVLQSNDRQEVGKQRRVAQWESDPWRTKEGTEFGSVTVVAYKGNQGPCPRGAAFPSCLRHENSAGSGAMMGEAALPGNEVKTEELAVAAEFSLWARSEGHVGEWQVRKPAPQVVVGQVS